MSGDRRGVCVSLPPYLSRENERIENMRINLHVKTMSLLLVVATASQPAGAPVGDDDAAWMYV